MRSVFFGVFQSFVVLLYILDNETNFVVQVSVFIGVLIDLWKITKVMDVRVRLGGHAVLGLPGVGRGTVRSAGLWSWPRVFPSAGCTPRTKGIFAPGDFSGHMWGRGTGNSGAGQGLEPAGGTAADHGLPPCPKLDREHKVAGLFPRPTFKDKSTYIESSTKVYDDVSIL